MKKIFKILPVIICIYTSVHAQQDSLYEAVTELEVENEILQELMESYTDNPLDINNASENELRSIPFVSDSEISKIIEFRPFENKSAVRTCLGKQKYEAIRPFITVLKYKPPWRIHFRQKNYLPLQQVKAIETRKFYNSNIDNYSKIQFHYRENFSAGLLWQKDIGEKSIADHYSGYLQYTNPQWQTNLIAGQFLIQAGHGLIFSSPFSNPKSSLVLLPLRNKSVVVRPYLTASEASGFTGISVEKSAGKNYRLGLVFAGTLRDGTVDQTGTVVTGLDYSGYHRSLSERNKENLVRESLTAVYAESEISDYFSSGMVLAHTAYSPGIRYNAVNVSDNTLRRDYFRFSGDKIRQAALFWNFHLPEAELNGEIAYTIPGDLALSVNFAVRSEQSALGMKWWHVPKNFQSPFGSVFGANGYFPQGNQGIYLAVQHDLSDRLELAAYWQQDKSLWRTYFEPMPVDQKDFFSQVGWEIYKKQSVLFRYRFKNNMHFDSDTEQTIDTFYRNFRVEYYSELNKNIRLRSRVEKVFLEYSEQYPDRQGVNIFQDISARITERIWIQTRYSSFSIEDYESRIYEFENDVPSAFSSYVLNGKGNKWYFVLKWEVYTNLRLYLKYRTIFYDGVESIGSGDLQTSGNIRRDIRFVLDYRL